MVDRREFNFFSGRALFQLTRRLPHWTPWTTAHWEFLPSQFCSSWYRIEPFAVFLLYLKLHHILAKEGLQFSRSHAPTGPFEISGGQAMECLYNVRFAKVELLTRNTPPYARFRYRCQRCT